MAQISADTLRTAHTVPSEIHTEGASPEATAVAPAAADVSASASGSRRSDRPAQAYRIKTVAPADTIAADSLAADTAVIDTTVHDTSYVIMIDRRENPGVPPRVEMHGLSAGLSWIMGGLLLLFVIIAIRFHNNSRYLGAMLKSAIEVRERGNVFDDTVRETSFVVLLNVMWTLCAGVLLFILVGGNLAGADAARGMGISVGLTVGYELFLVFAYWMVGNVFSDRLHTRMWLRGFLSATGFTTLILFPATMMVLCYPANAEIAMRIGIGAVILGKIVFIWKGFRIFFSQIGSWVLFLYYLCSLEIVPLVLLYAGAAWLCV
ncbi:MAG: DUF4271 domain-containing protein [Muribaculaceae bacterium]|nr:DUF4271 domain-containing protein [Muribaculaceae bacterium]